MLLKRGADVYTHIWVDRHDQVYQCGKTGQKKRGRLTGWLWFGLNHLLTNGCCDILLSTKRVDREGDSSVTLH